MNLILVDRAALLSGFFADGQERVCVFVACMHVCMLEVIKENFLSSSLSFYNPAAIPLPGIPAARSLQTHTHSMLTHTARAIAASE